MKRNNPLSTFMIICSLTASLLLTVSCRKENTLVPSNLDENYFVVKDNPNDPVDHALYEFYKSTGIASFMNDTIHKKQIGDSAGLPRYSYITLSLSYTLFSGKLPEVIDFKPVSKKSSIPALLDLLKQELLPRLPQDLLIPSFFLVDSIWTSTHPQEIFEIADGWTSWHGFNTVAISAKDVELMNEDERKMYTASLLAGMAEKRLRRDFNETLNKDFFSVSRTFASTKTTLDIYSGNPFFFLGIDPVPPPPELGFVRYFRNALAVLLGLPDPVGPPAEEDDLRTFLTAAFYYTPGEFNNIYSGSTLMLEKFETIREIAKNAGFKIRD